MKHTRHIVKICDLRDEQVTVGMRIRSVTRNGNDGVIVAVRYPLEDRYQWAEVRWNDGKESGFRENDSACEVVDPLELDYL